MKKYLSLIAAFCFWLCNAYAQDADTTRVKDGGRGLKPEFTVRYSAGMVTSGPAVTGGVRIDNKRTLGLWIGLGNTYNDAAPASIHAIQTAAYLRRYFQLGHKDKVALYGEFILGCDWIYRINGGEKYIIYDSDTGMYYEEGGISESTGDVGFYAGINAGISFRIIKNIHLYLGPTLTTNTIGLHAGIGF